MHREPGDSTLELVVIEGEEVGRRHPLTVSQIFLGRQDPQRPPAENHLSFPDGTVPELQPAAVREIPLPLAPPVEEADEYVSPLAFESPDPEAADALLELEPVLAAPETASLEEPPLEVEEASPALPAAPAPLMAEVGAATVEMPRLSVPRLKVPELVVVSEPDFSSEPVALLESVVEPVEAQALTSEPEVELDHVHGPGCAHDHGVKPFP